MKKIEIKVPATSANLGPGFDALGISLTLFNTYIFEKNDNCYKYINIEKKYANDNNLVITSAKATYRYLNVKEIFFSLEEMINIPITRGLGSSAACIIAGILAASYFSNEKLSDEEVIKIATEIEGHPDNVSPAYLGGLICSIKNYENGEIIWTKYNIENDLIYTVLIPDFPLSTSKARQVLPEKLSYKDIVYSMSRAINIPKALEEKDVNKLYYLLDDRLHQPYRFNLIKDSLIYKEYAKVNKLPFCISGSGSTLLFITNKSIKNKLEELEVEAKWEIVELKINNNKTVVKEINYD